MSSYRLVPRWDDTGGQWDVLLEAGEAYGVLPCGLGARDTLRTEMGYPLHGQDLTLDITPVQARLGWAVGWRRLHSGDSAKSFLTEREARRGLLRGLEADQGYSSTTHAVPGSDGASMGEVTSGTSRRRRIGIGLALLASDVSEGDVVSVDAGRRLIRVVNPPFVQPSAASCKVFLLDTVRTPFHRRQAQPSWTGGPSRAAQGGLRRRLRGPHDSVSPARVWARPSCRSSLR